MISFVGRTSGTTTGNSLAVATPTSLVAGDFLVWVVVSWQFAPTATPAGWTWQGDVGGNAVSRLWVYTRPWSAGMGSQTITFGGVGNHVGQIIALRGVDLAAPINAVGGNNNTANSTSHVCPSVTTTTPNTLILRASATGTTNASRTYSWPAPVTDVGTTRSTAGYRYLTTGLERFELVGGAGTRAATFSESVYSYAATVAFRPRRRIRLGGADRRLMLGSSEKWIMTPPPS